MIVFLVLGNFSNEFVVPAGQHTNQVTKEPVWLTGDMEMEAKHFKVVGKFLKDCNSIDSCFHSLSL